jgi:glycosyltransferase involved in cell wall biosynthesis
MTMTSSSRPVQYVVISPVRDEAQHLERTIESMVSQTIRPAQWVLVNDGSADETGAIIDHWASREPWIVAVHRPDRGSREPGNGVIDAFYDGYNRITANDWEFLIKLDGDVAFDADYFAQCFAEFDADSHLGIGGGVICHPVDGQLQVEPNPRFHVRGASKIYRRPCWQDIAGLVSAPGWDTIDEVKANMLGWSTRSFANLKVIHYRFTGAAKGPWSNAVKNGLGSYVSGYHPVFILLKCVKHLFEKPYLLASAGLLYGFILGYVRRVPQIPDKSLIKYLRAQQLRRLLFCTTIWK